MPLIDTNVAICLRDANQEIVTRLDALSEPPAISIMTWAELEGGVYREPALVQYRLTALDTLLTNLTLLPFDEAVVMAYGDIVSSCGFVRSKVFDRLIAATAIVHRMTLITMNGADFRDIPNIALEVWPSPAAQ